MMEDEGMVSVTWSSGLRDVVKQLKSAKFDAMTSVVSLPQNEKTALQTLKLEQGKPINEGKHYWI